MLITLECLDPAKTPERKAPLIVAESILLNTSITITKRKRRQKITGAIEEIGRIAVHQKGHALMRERMSKIFLLSWTSSFLEDWDCQRGCLCILWWLFDVEHLWWIELRYLMMSVASELNLWIDIFSCFCQLFWAQWVMYVMTDCSLLLLRKSTSFYTQLHDLDFTVHLFFCN